MTMRELTELEQRVLAAAKVACADAEDGEATLGHVAATAELGLGVTFDTLDDLTRCGCVTKRPEIAADRFYWRVAESHPK